MTRKLENFVEKLGFGSAQLDLFQSFIVCVLTWFTDQPGHCGQKMPTEETAAIVNDLLWSVYG